MRFSRKLRKKIELFIEFIQLWYSKEELETEVGNLLGKFDLYLESKDMTMAKNIIEHLDYIAEANIEEKIKIEIREQVINMLIDIKDYATAEERLTEKIEHYKIENNSEDIALTFYTLASIKYLQNNFIESKIYKGCD